MSDNDVSEASATKALIARLEEALAEYKPNATYANPPTVKDYMSLPIVKAAMWAIDTGGRSRIIGPPGIAKTAFIRWLCDLLGFRLVVIAASQITIENLVVPFPVDDEESGRRVLDFLLYHELADTSPMVILIDDFGRAHPSMGSTLMELLQEGSLAGKPLPHLKAVITTDNLGGTLDGTGTLAHMDTAVADRVATCLITSADTPWRWYLAETFPKCDLTELFSVYNHQDKNVRLILSPRVLEHMLELGFDGLPLIWALPIVNGVRQNLINASEVDVTDEVLGKIANAIGVAQRDHVPDAMEKLLAYAIRRGRNVYIEGPPGIGKTSWVKAKLAEMGMEHSYISAPAVTPEDTSVPMPAETGTELDLVPHRMLMHDQPWLFVVDEIYRGSRRLQSALMPIMQEKMLGGKPLTHLIGTVALNNPRQVAGYKLDVGKNDLAVAGRFGASVQITAADLPWSAYLYTKYGELVSAPFVEWWQEDIDDLARLLCSPRCLERMIELHLYGMDIQWALPFVNGEYVAVPLNLLHERLAKQPVARLRQIVEDIDNYEALLGAGALENPDVHVRVYFAFSNAELPQLEEHKDACLRLLRVLDTQHRINLLRQGGERQQFWLRQLRQLEDPK